VCSEWCRWSGGVCQCIMYMSLTHVSACHSQTHSTTVIIRIVLQNRYVVPVLDGGRKCGSRITGVRRRLNLTSLQKAAEKHFYLELTSNLSYASFIRKQTVRYFSCTKILPTDIYFVPVGLRSIVMSMYVCVAVCL